MSDGSEGSTVDGWGEPAEVDDGDGAGEDDDGSWLDPATLIPPVGIGVLYLATVLGGLALTDEVDAAGIVAFTNPHAVGNVAVFAVVVVAFTGIAILAQRLGFGMQLIRLYMLAVFGMLVGDLVVALGFGTHVAGVPTSPVPAVAGLATMAVLWFYPEWYVIDVAAVVGGIVIIPIFGLSFGPLPIVVLLVVWAAYDAYSVYVSGHMQELAGGMSQLKAPMMYVVPYTLDFSMLDLEDMGLGLDPATPEEEGGAEPPGSAGGGARVGEDEPGGAADVTDDAGGVTDEEGIPEAAEDLPVTFLGLGDAIIPGMLAVSAGKFLDAPVVVDALNANLPAVGALVGGVVGLAALMVIAQRYEGVHAGLPPLNAGVLGGYLVGAVLGGVPLTAALGI